MKSNDRNLFSRGIISTVLKVIMTVLGIVLILNIFQTWTSNMGHMEAESRISQYLSDNVDLFRDYRRRFGNSDPDTANCNFEDYIFGQPAHQTDPCLIATFKKKMLRSPPLAHEVNRDPLNITGEMPSNIEKFRLVEKILIENTGPDGVGNKPGFFIECGANDGEFISPTIRLERKYNWTGLLIEANPIPFKSLMQKKRNAWAVNAAACITEYAQQLTFYTNPKETGISGLNANPRRGVNVNITVQCIPLYTMLSALNIRTIDYFSLDVEGLELAILKTLPFDKINFKVLTVEYLHIPGKQEALKQFLEPLGYKFVKEVRDSLTLDCLYVHQSLYETAKSVN